MKTSLKKTIRTSAGFARVCSLLAVALLFRAHGADDHQERIENARMTMEKWIETRRAISEEKQDWKLAEEMLTERIRLVRQEIDSLREKNASAEESIGEADKKRADLVDENEALKEASDALDDAVTAFERRTLSVLKRIPAPIRKQVKPLSQRIPENPEKTKLSIGERFQNIVGILNEINKFNGVITVTSEVRDLGNESAEVTAMYVGLGHAYYANTGGEDAGRDIAGYGFAAEDGWTWTAANDAAPRIRRAIAIFKNEEVAGFVRLPVNIK